MWSFEHVSAIPVASWHELPVSSWESVFFKHVSWPVWNLLIVRESFIWLISIFEFHQHQFIVSSKERAGGITFILSIKIFSFSIVNKIINNNWRLAEHCCSCFSGWGCGDISECENIWVLLMLKSVDININKVTIQSKRRFTNKFVRSVWRYNM
jgi:hypothetical protein